MIDIENFKTTPMGMAVAELSTRLQEKDLPPVSLNVIGGFAMMMRDLRDPYGFTDIDYVGSAFSKEFNDLAEEIGQKYNLGSGWINNDAMLSGISVEDFEFVTGELHFEPAFTIGGITINVLEEPDLLRMKLISLDTSLTAVEQGGDFTRMKDFPDVQILMDRQGITPGQLDEEYGEHFIYDHTAEIIQTYYDEGEEGVLQRVKSLQLLSSIELMREREYRLEPERRSPYMQDLLDNMLALAEERAKTPDSRKR